jgi:hypothetical protein
MANQKYANKRDISELRARMIADLVRCIEAGLSHEVTCVFWPRAQVPARVRSRYTAFRLGEPWPNSDKAELGLAG